MDCLFILINVMRFSKKIVLILIITIVTSCRQKNNQEYSNSFKYSEKFDNENSISEMEIDLSDVKIIKIPEDINSQSILTNGIEDSMKFIQLETASSCLTGTIDRLLFVDDKIIVCNLKRQKEAFIFTNDGKFVKKLGEKGKGPNEYLSMDDVFVHHKTNQIILYDGQQRKFFFYDSSGNLNKIQEVFYYGLRAGMTSNQNTIIYQNKGSNFHFKGSSNYQIIKADSTQKIIGKSLPYSQPEYNPNIYLVNYNRFNTVNDKILYAPIYTNKIYEFSSNSRIKLKYNLDLGEKDFLKNIKSYKSQTEKNNAINSSKLWCFSGLAIEAGDYLFSKINNGGYFFYNKKSGELVCGNSFSSITYFSEKKSLPKLPLNISNTLTSNGDKFVTVIYPDELFFDNKEVLKFQKIKKLVKLGDNPILGFYTFKK